MASTVSKRPTTVGRARRLPRIDLWHVFSYLILGLGTVIAIVPFLYMISASLMTLGEATGRALLPSVPQWSNYVEAWQDANFSEYTFACGIR